jgi:hypothetical protein
MVDQKTSAGRVKPWRAGPGIVVGVACVGVIIFVFHDDTRNQRSDEPGVSSAETRPTLTIIDEKASPTPERASAFGFPTSSYDNGADALRSAKFKEKASSLPFGSTRHAITGVPSDLTFESEDVSPGILEIPISGKVTLRGIPPPEQPLPLDPTCGRLNQAVPLTRFYRVAADGGLADVVVYIKEGLSGNSYPPSNLPAIIEEFGCLFNPYVLGLQTGQKLVVRNSDPVVHNLHITPSTNSGNLEMNRAQPSGSEIELTFQYPELFMRLKCDIHVWMFAYLAILNHPFFAVTDANGFYALPSNLPPGTYTIEAYHQRAGSTTRVFTTNAGENPNLDFVLEVPPDQQVAPKSISLGGQ